MQDIGWLVDLNNQFYGAPHLSLSMGASTGQQGERMEAVIKRADMRMYEQKGALRTRGKRTQAPQRVLSGDPCGADLIWRKDAALLTGLNVACRPGERVTYGRSVRFLDARKTAAARSRDIVRDASRSADHAAARGGRCAESRAAKGEKRRPCRPSSSPSSPSTTPPSPTSTRRIRLCACWREPRQPLAMTQWKSATSSMRTAIDTLSRRPQCRGG